jgi:hypothetical protein
MGLSALLFLPLQVGRPESLRQVLKRPSQTVVDN